MVSEQKLYVYTVSLSLKYTKAKTMYVVSIISYYSWYYFNNLIILFKYYYAYQIRLLNYICRSYITYKLYNYKKLLST